MFKFIVFIICLLLEMQVFSEDTYVIENTCGLGNQMFMIAAQTSYAQHFAKKVCLLNPFNSDFNVNYRPCTPQEAAKAQKHICKFEKYTDSFWQKDDCLTANTGVSFFQDTRFFAPYSEQIKEMFKFNKPLTGNAAAMAQKIANTNSVSVHIRRGDYLIYQETYPILPLQYYENGADYIQEHTQKPIHLFVFSNDIEWVKEDFSSKYPFTIVSGNDDSVDMHLMSLCKHNIIANSTFSWWGAWLNQNKNKIVIAPDKWLHDDEQWGKDIVPEDWVVLPSYAAPKPKIIH